MSDSEEDQNIPDQETCRKLTEEFADITGTDTACAQFYLQDRAWDLERSVNAYFEVSQSGGINVLNDGDTPNVVINVDKKMAQALAGASAETTVVPPSKFHFITWNLDGLDDHNLKKRTKAVCKIISIERPDVVFFQELIPETYTYIEEHLPEYMCIAGNTEGYFTATLLRRFTVYFDSHVLIPFPNTRMMRNLLIVEAHIGPTKLALINSHLESTVEHAGERVNQLKQGFSKAINYTEEYTVIFAGDMNLRDKELDSIGGLPAGVEDVWQLCGSRKSCQYTWDLTRNTNKEIASRFKPRCRFDRVFLRSSSPRSVVPKHFGLLGLEKVALTQSFPSDHWGIQVYFDINRPESGNA